MANKSISQLSAGAAVSGADLFPSVQTVGIGPVKVTATQLGTFALTGVFDPAFAFSTSSKSLTLGVASSSTGSLVLNNANHAFSVTLQSSNSTTGSATYTLPVALPAANNYILTSTTGGITSWTNPTALGIDLDVGTTTITNGVAGRLLFEGAGNVLQESANLTFSTATLTLGVQDPGGVSGVQGGLVLANTAAGAYSVTIRSSNGASAGWTMTLPPAAPAGNDYILTSTTSGVTSWSNPTALGIDLDVGTTAITNGVAGRILYQGAGDVLQENANLTFASAAITLGVQQTTRGSIVLANTAAGAWPVTLQSSNSTTAAWTLTLPTTAGAGSGYVLATDGTGVTSWVQAGGVSTGFTQGSVVFAGASGALSQNNANFFWDNSNNRLGIKTATPAVSLAINTTDAILLPKGADGDRPAGVAGYLRYNTTSNQFEGYNGTAWGSIGGGASITDETTNATRYPLFANATTGSLTSVFVSSTKYTFNPSTGILSSVATSSTNGISLNATTVSADFTVPTGYNGLSAGPITVDSGITVTVSANSAWVVT